MTERLAQNSLGCEHCWPDSPDVAWDATRTLACEVDLVDESHFHVKLVMCPSCSQSFVSVFTETIDWADGEDPQYWVILPLTRAEATDLAGRRGALSEAYLSALGPDRRCLLRDYPKGAAPSCHWGAGLSVRCHD
jgi:hypothetical protein